MQVEGQVVCVACEEQEEGNLCVAVECEATLQAEEWGATFVDVVLLDYKAEGASGK